MPPSEVNIPHNAGFRVNSPIVFFPAVVGHGCYAAHDDGVRLAEYLSAGC